MLFRSYPLMRELEETYPDVSVGSYPNFETKELEGLKIFLAEPATSPPSAQPSH